MRFVLTALIFVIGLFDLMIAASFLIDPLTAGQALGVVPDAGIGAGLSTLRGDFTAFFGVAGFAMSWGAWRRNADLLLVPLLLFAVTLAGRAVNLVLIGPYPDWPLPMAVEAVEVIALLAGWRYLPHHPIAELVD